MNSTKQKMVLVLAFLLGGLAFAQSPSNYDLTAGDGNGFRFWNGSDNYKIHMGTGTEYHYGGVTSYSIKMNINDTPGRGWTWGIAGQMPIASLNNQGDFHFQGELYANNGWLRVKGNKGLFFQDYGGGLFMQDNTWIRTYGNKSFYHNSGTMRTDGRFEVGPSGDRFVVNSLGNVGVGTTNPEAKLKVYRSGTIGGFWNTNGSFFTLSDGPNALIMDTNELYSNTTLNLGSKAGDIIRFRTITDSGSSDKVVIKSDGSMGIGTLIPDAKLAVNGNIHAKEVKVDLVGWPDYVFNDNYDLPTLDEVENYIKAKGHLINIPSAEEVAKNGVQLGEMNKLLLEKIEELTLYIIDQDKTIAHLKDQNKILRSLQHDIELIKQKLKNNEEH